MTGPIGLVGMVGDARSLGLAYLLGFVALISVNLAVINLAPFPALDGGRLLVLLIEAVYRRPLPAGFVNMLNMVGFALLIGLMIIVSYHDLVRLFVS
jgi:regulator of sigma E protease